MTRLKSLAEDSPSLIRFYLGTYSSLGVNNSTPGVGASNKRTARERLSSELRLKEKKQWKK